MKSTVIDKAKDIKGNELKVGDHVAYITCLWDPFISTGTIVKLYNTDPDEIKYNPNAEFWCIKATIEDDNYGKSPNIQIRRIIKL